MPACLKGRDCEVVGFPSPGDLPGVSLRILTGFYAQPALACASEGANPNTPPGDHLSPPQLWQGQAEGLPRQRPSLVDQAGWSEAGGSPLPFQRS